MKDLKTSIKCSKVDNCSLTLVLDKRTNKATDVYPLAICFQIAAKRYYYKLKDMEYLSQRQPLTLELIRIYLSGEAMDEHKETSFIGVGNLASSASNLATSTRNLATSPTNNLASSKKKNAEDDGESGA